jgi:hypothetical protein
LADEGMTMTALISSIANDRSAELRRTAASRRRVAFGRKARVTRREAQPSEVGDVGVRRLDRRPSDRAALEYLADLDSSEPLTGEVLGAELDGALVAAISLTTGDVIADPFTRTDQIRSLLELRASQLRGGGQPRFGRRRRGSHLHRTAEAR